MRLTSGDIKTDITFQVKILKSVFNKLYYRKIKLEQSPPPPRSRVDNRHVHRYSSSCINDALKTRETWQTRGNFL